MFAELAAEEKFRLEEKQRAARRERNQTGEKWRTRLVDNFLIQLLAVCFLSLSGRCFFELVKIIILFLYRWFDVGINKWTGKEDWIYNDKYFNRDWSDCPDIY